MNNQNTGFYFDIGALIAGLIILVAFLALPYIGLSGIASVTPLQILSVANLAGAQTDLGFELWPIMMMLIAGAALVTSIAAGVALGKREYSRVVSYVIMACGAIILLIQLFFLFQLASDATLGATGGGLNMALAIMGFGYWLIFLCSIFLILQVFISRQAGFRTAPPVPPGGMPPSFVPPVPAPRPQPSPAPVASVAPPRPSRAFVNAWLVDLVTQQSYQLFQGETRVGRSRQRNDIVLEGETVSREHLIIRQEGQHFVAYATGTQVAPYINGIALQGKQVLNTNDEIVLGEKQLRFIRS
jgi:hypothetical protein